jgi:hypothetical protein
MVVCLVVAAAVSLSELHALAGMLLVAAVVMIMFVCPFILLILQRNKVSYFPIFLFFRAHLSKPLTS